MAAIDKTYLTSKEQYHQIVNWCKGKIVYDKPFTHWAGEVKKRILASDFIYQYTDEKLDEIISKGGEIILWNTPTYFDVWLIRNCPFDFIQDRLKEQYGGDWSKTSLTDFQEESEYDLIKNYKSIYDTYKRNGLGKKVKYTKPKIHLKKGICRGGRGGSKNEVYITILDNNFTYDDANDCWNHELELKPQTSYGDFYQNRDFNWKWFTRKLQKWNLPKGIVLDIEVWAITNKKMGIKQQFKIITR